MNGLRNDILIPSFKTGTSNVECFLVRKRRRMNYSVINLSHHSHRETTNLKLLEKRNRCAIKTPIG